MSDECKLFVRNIPDAFPEDKFNEILKKQFENSVSNVNMYKHVHKFKNKLNKVCYFSVKSEETRQKVFDFFANFELIDQRGLKHKLKVITSLFPLNNTTDIEDKLNNTYNQLNHFQKFTEFFNNGKVIEFKLEEDKYNEGIFDGVEEKKPEVDIPDKNKVIPDTTKSQQIPGKKMIITNKLNVEKSLKRDENIENNLIKSDVEVLAEETGFNNQTSHKKVFNNKNTNQVKGNHNQSNNNYYNNNHNNNYYNNNSSYNNNYYNNSHNNNYYNNNSGYNNNYYNNNNYKGGNYNYNNNENNSNYYKGNDGYYEEEGGYSKKNKGYYKK